MLIISFVYVEYMWNLRGTFVSSSYMVMQCEVDIADGSIYPYSIVVVWLILAMWPPYVFSDISVMCTVIWG